MNFNIEGYENMTPEEKIAALEANYPDVAQIKANADKAASEAADYKKKWREALSEDEAKKAKEAEERAALIERAEKAENALAVSNYTAAYIAMGYDEKLARSTAEAMAKGDTDTVFKNQKIHQENRDKALKAELLKQTPPPAAGSSNTGKTREELNKMTLAEKAKYAEANPEAYKELYGG